VRRAANSRTKVQDRMPRARVQMPIYGVFLAMTYKLSHSRKIALIASCALLFSLFGVIPARAQNTGIATVGPISYSVTQCNGTPQIITPPELGQSVHFVSYLATGAPTTLQVYMTDGSASSTQVISDVGTDFTGLTNSGGLITANGYYNVNIVTICTGGTSPVITLIYTGTSANAVPTTGVQDQTAWFKYLLQSQPENANKTVTLLTPYGNTCGVLYFKPNQGSNSGTISVSGISASAVGTSTFVYNIAAGFVNQKFNMPCEPGQSIQITYTQGTPNAGTFNLYYAFYKPGLFPNLTSPNSGTSSTSALQVVSDQLNQSYWSTETAVNPAAGSYILETRNSNSSRSLYFDHVHLTSTVAVQLNVVFITNSGTGCSAGSPSIMVGANGSPSQATVDVTCTTNANTYGTGFPVFLAANSSYDLDLRGFIALANTTLGIGIQSPSAVTGQVSATTYWYEK